MSVFYDQFGIRRKISDLTATDRLFELKRQSGSSPWPVIEECFKIFKSTNPKQYDSNLIRLGEIRETRKDRKFASTRDKKTGGILRYTIDIPVKVHHMIRCIYSPEELPMDREFWLHFARRFPEYKIAEKL